MIPTLRISGTQLIAVPVIQPGVRCFESFVGVGHMSAGGSELPSPQHKRESNSLHVVISILSRGILAH